MGSYASVQTLVDGKVASRVYAKDATLYDFDENALDFGKNFMGWTDLASNPPVSIDEIQSLADRLAADGIEHAVLIGQGGSTQASMTMTKFLKGTGTRMDFRTLDSDSPVRLRQMLAACDPAKTVVVVSSKSGGTLEMRLMLSAVRDAFSKSISEAEFAKHLVAITDPGSDLEARSASEGWAATLPGEPTVGGRFSALSVFGLLPAALVGVDLKKLVAAAAEAERDCSADSPDNPALQLGAFLYDNYKAGRDKFAFVTQKRTRALGLWTEQLIAESTGKDGQGILPYVEVDTLLLAKDAGDRTVITYKVLADSDDEQRNFDAALSVIDPVTPRIDYVIDSIEGLVKHFIMWEYATAMCGYLMRVCPFDQPNVASAKARVLEILDAGLPVPDFTQDFIDGANRGVAKVRVSGNLSAPRDIRGALESLLASVKPGDFFAVNAFLPFAGEGRREALESVRFAVADSLGVPSCLEIGPRFLHSTGQLQKGGPATGVFLVLSADEADDVVLAGQPAASLGELAEAQATGDALTLIERGRRCVHLHLPDNSATTLRLVAKLVREALAKL
ncbi:MAG: glucose-6-phosphate isomerase [Eggerthellaceae bacterium]|nr:glucose-6-phosphate isomerase [Eggerthellaceae bacterium]